MGIYWILKQVQDDKWILKQVQDDKWILKQVQDDKIIIVIFGITSISQEEIIMKKILLIWLLVLFGLFSSFVMAADESQVQTDYQVKLLVPLGYSLDLHQGWQEKNFADLDVEITDSWWDACSVDLLVRFSPDSYTYAPLVFYSGFGLGLGYKEIPYVSESSRMMAIIGGDIGFFWRDFKLSVNDYLKIRFLSPYAPLEKIESNQFEVLAAYYFGEDIEAELKYGFTNWRPYDHRQVGILALGRARLGRSFGLAGAHIVVGYQGLSQRFASDNETWRWLSGLGCFCTLQKYPFKLDLFYNRGRHEKARWWLVEKNNSHQIGLKFIFGQ